MHPFFTKHHLEIKTAEDYLLTVIRNILAENTTPDNKMVEHVASRIKTIDSITEKLTHCRQRMRNSSRILPT